jgi:hypothetical protein
MNYTPSISTVTPIQINETFLRLVNGAAAVQDIVSERRHARAALLAHEDGYGRRRREQSELFEAFQASLGYRNLLTEF